MKKVLEAHEEGTYTNERNDETVSYFVGLPDCRTDLNILIFDISEHNAHYDHALFQCTLKEVHIGVKSIKLPNKTFESGVVKI